ncbi:unnamed protein product [Dovyalis caffra]|uniref:Uncharacterized protein n=1 Tax=Dovyalis caffra TaxID=77055 RepID=A0AAV1STK1_9ROSI|nr:unnamed protein product [Dovyalis caffra]
MTTYKEKGVTQTLVVTCLLMPTGLLSRQPSWLDDLLNEPETTVRRGGHRRLSSDSFAYIDVANASNIDYAAQDEYRYKNVMSIPSWGSQDFDYYKDVRQTSLHAELNMTKKKNRAWDSSLNAPNYPRGLSCARKNAGLQSSRSSFARREADGVSESEKQDPLDGPHDPKISSTKKESSNSKCSASETDTKRAKQNYTEDLVRTSRKMGWAAHKPQRHHGGGECAWQKHDLLLLESTGFLVDSPLILKIWGDDEDSIQALKLKSTTIHIKNSRVPQWHCRPKKLLMKCPHNGRQEYHNAHQDLKSTTIDIKSLCV